MKYTPLSLDDLKTQLARSGVIVFATCKAGKEADMPKTYRDARKPRAKEPLRFGRIDRVVGTKAFFVSDHGHGGLVPVDSLLYFVDIL